MTVPPPNLIALLSEAGASTALTLKIGEERYHHKHRLFADARRQVTRGQFQAWLSIATTTEPASHIKDAAILARSKIPPFRLSWRKRSLDHDGDGAKNPAAIEKIFLGLSGPWVEGQPAFHASKR